MDIKSKKEDLQKAVDLYNALEKQKQELLPKILKLQGAVEALEELEQGQKEEKK